MRGMARTIELDWKFSVTVKNNKQKRYYKFNMSNNSDLYQHVGGDVMLCDEWQLSMNNSYLTLSLRRGIVAPPPLFRIFPHTILRFC